MGQGRSHAVLVGQDSGSVDETEVLIAPSSNGIPDAKKRQMFILVVSNTGDAESLFFVAAGETAGVLIPPGGRYEPPPLRNEDDVHAIVSNATGTDYTLAFFDVE